jgi:septum formation protein
MSATTEVILASSSARRARILSLAGVQSRIIAPALDDSDAPLDFKDPCATVMSLAWFKARLVLGQIAAGETDGLGEPLPRWMVAADTMCVHDGKVIGKPQSVDHMRSMIRSFRGRMHDVVTGVCIVDRSTQARQLFFDSAQVHLGMLDDAAFEAYAAGEQWRGKAGGYNYEDCLNAGWPLRCDGDPETVMGLPSRLVLPAVGAHRAASGSAS